MVAAEAILMPTPLGSDFHHLKELYRISWGVSLCNLHKISWVWLDRLSAEASGMRKSHFGSVQTVQESGLDGVVRESASACDRIVQQVQFHSGQVTMTESNVPLTARVACAG